MLFLLQAAGKESSPGGMLSLLFPFILMFVVMYFLILRPQRQKEKARKSMLSRIKKNDLVVTVGGVHGTVASVRENSVILKIDESKDVKIKVDRSAIAELREPYNEVEEEEEAKETKGIAKESKGSK